jgi:hypothetical protein
MGSLCRENLQPTEKPSHCGAFVPRVTTIAQSAANRSAVPTIRKFHAKKDIRDSQRACQLPNRSFSRVKRDSLKKGFFEMVLVDVIAIPGLPAVEAWGCLAGKHSPDSWCW